MGQKHSNPPPQRPYQSPEVINAVYSSRPAPYGPQTDLSSFGVQRPTATNQTAVAIRPDALIFKDSFSVTEDYPGSSVLSVSFHFLARFPCAISAYQFAVEESPGRFRVEESKGGKTIVASFAPCERSQFPPQLLQLDASQHPPAMMEFRDLKTYPLVVEIHPQYPDSRPPQCYLSYVMYRKQNNSWRPVVVKQIFVLSGVPNVLQDLYGFQSSESDEIGSECVICLTEKKHVAVMPCRHVCLCEECAGKMNAGTGKCPVCRGPIQSYMNLRVQTDAR